MKLNNPATWLLVAAVAAVGVAAVAGGKRFAYAEDGCRRIVFTDEAGIDQALQGIDARIASQNFATAEALVDAVLKDLFAQAVPSCPWPLPADAVIVALNGEEVSVSDFRELLLVAITPQFEAASAGARRRRSSTPRAVAYRTLTGRN